MTNEIASHEAEPSSALAVVPKPRCPVNVRAAVPEDMGFIDELQKMHSHMVGWMPRKQIEGNIEAERILIAEDHAGNPIGYSIARDQYMKRDDVGIVYQVNVLPLKHRHLVGATLVKTVLERAAYGCRLFSCWCAQDIQGNYFWEALGFIPLAFRTGSRAKQRIHIFWQRRVRDGDEHTDYWFPSQTAGGAVAEDRLVLPIPPGTHWRDAKPVLLPGLPERPPDPPDEKKALPGGAALRPRPEQPRVSAAQKAAIARTKSKHLGGIPEGKAAVISRGGVKYIERADAPPPPEEEPKRPKRPRRPRQKHDPKYVAAARELRDRYLEELNSGSGNLLPPAAQGKYDVSRQIEVAASPLNRTPLIDAS